MPQKNPEHSDIRIHGVTKADLLITEGLLKNAKAPLYTVELNLPKGKLNKQKN